MLPRSNRVRKEWEIKRIFQRGKLIKSSLFSVRYMPTRLKQSRCTVTVSKKYDKRAVYRNELKRLFREAAHHLVLSLNPPMDIVILPMNSARDADFHVIEKALTEVFQKIGSVK